MVDCEYWVFDGNVECGVGYDDCDFDNVVVIWVEVCYFYVELDEV